MAEPNVGQRVRHRREELGLSRETVAAQAGISSSTVARLELQGAVPKLAILRRIAVVIDLPLADLVAA